MSIDAEVALIRHGLPTRIEGVPKPDPGLTEVGFEQARAVAEAVSVLQVSSIASSGLTRAKQTAAPTAEKLGMTVEIHEDLAEFDNGADFYIPIEDMIAENDPRILQWRELMSEPDVMGALANFRRTATAAVGRIAAHGPSGVVAIFCHGGVIGACVEKALGDGRIPPLEPGYGSITRIEIEHDGSWKLRSYNESLHIERIAGS